MKQFIVIIAIGLLFITGCTGLKTTVKGLENESFLVFIGNPLKYEEPITVNIDDKQTFKASVIKGNKARPEGNVYAISTGTHTVTVTYQKEVIYKQQIFLSAQETKEINLP